MKQDQLNKYPSISANSILSFYSINHQISKVSFNVKLPIFSNQYPELSLFREHIGNLSLQPYTANRNYVYRYKVIFYCFTLLFLSLGFVVFFKTASSFYFSYKLVKSFMIFLCGFLGSLSLYMCFSMKPEKEVLNQFIRKAKQQLTRIYLRRKIDLGLGRLFYFGKRYRQYLAYRQFYYETKEKINDIREEAFQLVRTVSNSTFDRKQKELLYNQTIAELNEKLTEIVLSFKHYPIQIFQLENF